MLAPYWLVTTQQPNGIWKVPAEGGTAVQLTSVGTYPQESSDGERVFYIAGGNEMELWSVSVNGGDEHREEGMPNLVNNISWIPYQDGIYFIDGPPAHFTIKYFNFSDRKTVPVIQIPRVSFLCCGIAVTHNKDTLLFSGLDQVKSDIMLAENFR